MEQRGTIFVEAMIVIAVIGVLAFLIGLVVRAAPQRQQAPANGAAGQAEPSPRWYEFTLALILLAAIAAFAIWLISSGTHWVWGETIEDWRADNRAIIFAAVMVALAVVGLVVSLVYALVQSSGSVATPRPAAAAAEVAPAGAALVPPAPSPLRVLGLLALVVAIVLLCWIALAPAAQFGLIAQLIYPASLGVTLVLLFDKATRTWSVKPGAEFVSRMAFMRSPDISARPRLFERTQRAEAGSLCGKLLGSSQPGAVLHCFLGHRPHRDARPLPARLRLSGRRSVAAVDLADRRKALRRPFRGGPRFGPSSSSPAYSSCSRPSRWFRRAASGRRCRPSRTRCSRCSTPFSWSSPRDRLKEDRMRRAAKRPLAVGGVTCSSYGFIKRLAGASATHQGA